MVGAHQRNGETAEIRGAAGIHRVELLEALRDKPHPEIVIRRDRGAVRFCDVERVADVIEMAVREHDVLDALDRRGFVRNEGGIAGEERIDQDGVPGKIEPKSGVAKPGDVHDDLDCWNAGILECARHHSRARADRKVRRGRCDCGLNCGFGAVAFV
jgi:hypothetical protein